MPHTAMAALAAICVVVGVLAVREGQKMAGICSLVLTFAMGVYVLYDSVEDAGDTRGGTATAGRSPD
ncbi:hypothetical protein [Niveibacterium sp. SC-1]|uniref:hypothetical protein n=1 Tax=Niveibacterium sp. SC-1 TaxID=3135646 RepID=UPI0031204F3D